MSTPQKTWHSRISAPGLLQRQHVTFSAVSSAWLAASAPSERLTLCDLLPRQKDRGPVAPQTSEAGDALLLALMEVELADGVMTSRHWPRGAVSPRLEELLVAQGFVPDPQSFHEPHPGGFAGQPVVFSLLETVLDPEGDCSSRFCVCVAPGATEASVLLLISKVPNFTRHFASLKHLRQLLAADSLGKGVEAFAAGLASAPVDILPRVPGVEGAWAASWALEELLAISPQVLGPEFVTLLSFVLQEKRILLLGKTQYTNKVAFLLWGLLEELKWFHLFLPAPLSGSICDMAVEECICPMLVTLPELPARYSTGRELPEGLVAVQVGPEGLQLLNQPTSRTRCCVTGCVSRQIPCLPGHRRLCKELRGVLRCFLRNDLSISEARRQAQDALVAEVRVVASMTRRYASEAPQIGSAGQAFKEAYRLPRFLSWLSACGNDRRFYKAHFDTQMFIEQLHGEISRGQAGA